MGWCFNVSFPFIRNSFSDFRDFYFQFLVLLVYNIQSFMKGFLLQFVNVKIYMFGITALTGFITPYSKAMWTLIGFELLIATIGTIATSTWIGAGILIQNFYIKHYRIINIILALTLLECIWSILR